MKKWFCFFLFCVMLVSPCMICYGETSVLKKEKEETSFDIYATYKAGKKEDFSAPVQDGTSKIELPNGVQISVRNVKQENLTMVVYCVSKEEKEAGEWFTSCMKGFGTQIQPFEIYFLDEDGNRISADGVTVEITMTEAFMHPVAFSLNSSGTVKELDANSVKKTITFVTDGNPYYVLAEKEVMNKAVPDKTASSSSTSTAKTTNTTTKTSGPSSTVSATQKAGSQIKTGDETDFLLPIAGMMGALGVLTEGIFYYKKRRKIQKQRRNFK